MYGSTQSPLVIRAEGNVGVGNGANVGVAVGAVCVGVALGDGVAVAGAGVETQAAATNGTRKNRMSFCLHKEWFHFETLG